MSTYEEKVVNTSKDDLSENGEVVHTESRRVEQSGDAKTTAVNVVWYIYSVVAALLGIRFILKIFGANASSGFVDFIYSVTGVLSSPFDRIFNVTSAVNGTTKSVFEPSILVAIVVYGLIAWGITKLFYLNSKNA